MRDDAQKHLAAATRKRLQDLEKDSALIDLNLKGNSKLKTLQISKKSLVFKKYSSSEGLTKFSQEKFRCHLFR